MIRDRCCAYCDAVMRLTSIVAGFAEFAGAVAVLDVLAETGVHGRATVVTFVIIAV